MSGTSHHPRSDPAHTLTPIFQQTFFWVALGADNAIDFALGKFQLICSPPITFFLKKGLHNHAGGRKVRLSVLC